MKNLIISSVFWIVLISGILYGVKQVKMTPIYKGQYAQLEELDKEKP